MTRFLIRYTRPYPEVQGNIEVLPIMEVLMLHTPRRWLQHLHAFNSSVCINYKYALKKNLNMVGCLIHDFVQPATVPLISYRFTSRDFPFNADVANYCEPSPAVSCSLRTSCHPNICNVFCIDLELDPTMGLRGRLSPYRSRTRSDSHVGLEYY